VGNGNQLIARRSERIHVRMPVTLFGNFGSQVNEHTVSTLDLSNHGVRVYAKGGLAPGQAVVLVTASAPPGKLAGRVVWTGPVGTPLEGQAGIEFLTPVTPPV
jgi:hypothetical protein